MDHGWSGAEVDDSRGELTPGLPPAAVDRADGEAGPSPSPLDAAESTAGDVADPATTRAPATTAELGALEQRLLAAFEAKLAWDAGRDRQLDALHAELVAHRRGLVDQALRPLLNALLRMHGELERTRAAVADAPEDAPPPEQLLAGVQDDLLLVLEDQGVLPFRGEGPFDSSRQRAVRTEPSDAPAGTVLRSLQPGFERGDALLRKEAVVVARPAQAATAASPSAGATPPSAARPAEDGP